MTVIRTPHRFALSVVGFPTVRHLCVTTHNDYIEVYQAKKVDGVYIQKLKIHYNYVGSIEIPDLLPLPEPDVLIQTRKRVAVSYSA